MEALEAEGLAPELRLALAYTPATMRAPLATFFALDQRLARIVSAATEPMLAQMRLAWWRDMLAKPVEERPTGDAVLDAIGEHWQGREHALTRLVEGWEHLLAEPPLPREAALAFAAARAEPFLVLPGDEGEAGDIAISAQRWALVDAAANLSDQDERAMMLDLASKLATRKTALPRALRGLAVLDALALRSLRRGGRPLMEGRGAALTALRAGLLGR